MENLNSMPLKFNMDDFMFALHKWRKKDFCQLSVTLGCIWGVGDNYSVSKTTGTSGTIPEGARDGVFTPVALLLIDLSLSLK
jgi:hypothetical protein